MMAERQRTQRQNLEQERGRTAWNNIKEVKQPTEEAKHLLDDAQDEKTKKDCEKRLQDARKLQKEYRSRARGLNAMIQINGLGQTLGFLAAKSKINTKKEKKDKDELEKADFLLLSHLTQWMREPAHFSAANQEVMNDGADGLLAWVVDPGTSSADYRRATAECLAFGTWLSRFAEAELEEPDSGD